MAKTKPTDKKSAAAGGEEPPRCSKRIAAAAKQDTPKMSKPKQTRQKVEKQPVTKIQIIIKKTTENKPDKRIRINIKTNQETNKAPAMTGSRRNPKRKAVEAAPAIRDAPDNILEEALKPLTDAERADWQGWIELESEPSFFSIILRDLGVPDIKVQEIFTLDAESLLFLPKPVFGMVFLYQCQDTDEDYQEEDGDHDVWFANQTVENSCATVALLNIVMNQDIKLGDRLSEFKGSTKNLSPVLRGHELGNNSFIRTAHNSFARRMDILNSDLCLENEASDWKASKTKKRAPKRKPTKKKKRRGDYSFHFIAYVSSGSSVYELDGLKSRPLELGAVAEEEDWTAIVRPQIEARMLQYQEDQLAFNLLALCRSPLVAYSNTITESLASIAHLDKVAASKHIDFPDMITEEDALALSAADLLEFGLTQSAIDEHALSQKTRLQIDTLTTSAQSAYQLRSELANAARAAMGEYRAELMSSAEDEQRVTNRKKDYGLALHTWVAKLAHKGVLEDIIRGPQ